MAALALARLAFGYQFQTPASEGPALMQRFGLDYAAFGTLVGAYMAPGVLTALPSGLLGRRYGERAVVGGGLLLMALGGAACAAAPTPLLLGLARAVSGAGAVVLVVMQGPMVAARFTGRGFMGVMGLMVGAFPVGVGLAGLLSEPLQGWGGWQASFVVGAAVAALSWAVLLASCRKGAATDATGKGWQMPSRPESVRVVVGGLTWTMYNAGFYAFLSYLPALLASRGHPAGMAAGVIALATWTTMPFTLLGGALAGRGRKGPAWVFAVGQAAFVASVAGTALVDWPLFWGLLFGTLGALHSGVMVAVGTLSARPENRAVGMGLFYTTYYVGGAGFPALCGWAADRMGDPSGALLAGAALTALAVPTWLAHQRLMRDAQA